MTCAEFQQVLPEMLEGDRNTEHAAHLASCSACSDLISDLKAISEAARQLRALDEPSPRVWNSLEIELRREGLIRQPQREPALVPSRARRPWAWMVPVAAVLLQPSRFCRLRMYRPRIVVTTIGNFWRLSERAHRKPGRNMLLT